MLALVSKLNDSHRANTDLPYRMASTMLLLLAASRIPALKQRLDSRILEAGSHLTCLIEPWMHLHDPVSPSVRQSLRMIGEVNTLLHAEFEQDGRNLDERLRGLI